jgi:hypothetical protein
MCIIKQGGSQTRQKGLSGGDIIEVELCRFLFVLGRIGISHAAL